MNEEELLKKFVANPGAIKEYIDACLIAMLKEKLRPFIEEEERRILYGDGHPAIGILQNPTRLPFPKKKKPKKKRGKKRKQWDASQKPRSKKKHSRS